MKIRQRWSRFRSFLNPSQPDFLIVGAMKAGTTSLHSMLNQHPNIRGSRPKELHFFDQIKRLNGLNKRMYGMHFLSKDLKGGTMFFESTPNYLYSPHSARLIHDFSSKMKVIISLREPASRALSHWKMFYYKKKWETRTFREVTQDSDSIYVKKGEYLSQIQRFRDLFPDEQILILDSNELLENHQVSCARITKFLGVSDYDFNSEKLHQGKAIPGGDFESSIEELKAFYEPHNAQLKHLLEGMGVQLSWLN